MKFNTPYVREALINEYINYIIEDCDPMSRDDERRIRHSIEQRLYYCSDHEVIKEIMEEMPSIVHEDSDIDIDFDEDA